MEAFSSMFTMLLRYTIVAAIFVLASSLEDEPPLVTTPLGAVVGHYLKSYENRTFAAFEGIPYGKPPVGDLRFAEPQAAEPWTGILNATAVRICAQLDLFGKIQGEEDCLYLNVYIPKHLFESDAPLDTIVYIHGGAFMLGDPNYGGPGYLMDRDIVYVTINYRLNIFGFLSTEDDVVSGNNGLKDQRLALKWVQSNIGLFRGDPNSVTLIGMSAGGASVYYHYISPQSKGLFQRVFTQSGTALSSWTLYKAPLDRTRDLGEFMGCNRLSTRELIECLRQHSADELIEQLSKFNTFHGFPAFSFTPVVEKPSDTAFITDHPYKLLESGRINDVPIVISAVPGEGILGLFFMGNSLSGLNEYWNEVLPYVLDYNYTVAESDKPLVAERIKQFYFGKENITDDDEDIRAFIKVFGDRFHILDFERAARMQAKVAKSPTYTILYEYQADQLPNTSLGVAHSQDSTLLHYAGQSFPLLSVSDRMVKEILVNLVTSFAKTGTPEIANVKWDPVTNAENFTYLSLHEPNVIKMVSTREIGPTEFWRSLPIKEYEKIDENTSSFSFTLRSHALGLLFFGALIFGNVIVGKIQC